MPPRFEILNTHKHRHLKVWREASHAHIKGIDTVDVVLAEFRAAAGAYPIVFVQEQPETPPLPVLLDHEWRTGQPGGWTGHYQPLMLRIHPFALTTQKDTDAPLIRLDRNSPLISENQGEPLFLPDGQCAPTLTHIMGLLSDLHRSRLETRQFCRVASELGLFTPLGGNTGPTGFHRIDETRLDTAGAAILNLLRKRGWLAAIYAHLISLSRLDGRPHERERWT